MEGVVLLLPATPTFSLFGLDINFMFAHLLY